jgi:DHA2 family multidrug resistance protein
MERRPLVEGNKAGISIVVMIGALMAFIDITIVNVALNDIRASFGTPIDQIGWVSTGYMMANIVVIPMTGWFQRRFGFRRYFAWSLFLFTAASMLCATAWSLPALVAFRALQGLGGGAIIPTAQTILFERYPQKEHGTASALFGLGAVTGPLLGPTLGGYLIDVSSWHWVFLVNVPLGILAGFLALRFIREPAFQPSKDPIDVWGIVLLLVGMASLQYVLEEGNREGWWDSRQITILAAVAVIGLVTFVIHELEAEYPIVDLRVFKNRSYLAGTGINLLIGLALFSGSFLLSLFAGTVLHYNALQIGRVFLYAGFIQIFIMPLVGKLSGRFDPRILLMIGVVGVTASLWMNTTLTGNESFADLVWPYFIRSATLGFAFIPVSVVALSNVSPERRGNATGLFNMTRELGGSIGTAWMGLILDRTSHFASVGLRAHITPESPITQEVMRTAGALAAQNWTGQGVPEAVLDGRIRLQSLIIAFDRGFGYALLAFTAAFILVLLLEKPTGAVDTSAAH